MLEVFFGFIVACSSPEPYTVSECAAISSSIWYPSETECVSHLLDVATRIAQDGGHIIDLSCQLATLPVVPGDPT
jgi:hypothetical protein